MAAGGDVRRPRHHASWKPVFAGCPAARPDLGWAAAHVTGWSGLATKGARMWGKRGDMVVHEREPFNAEPPPAVLAGQALTPLEAFYSRNHGPFPDLAPDTWRLRIDGLVDRHVVLSLADLKERFRPRTEVVTLVCAGNRRAELMTVRPVPGQVPW